MVLGVGDVVAEENKVMSLSDEISPKKTRGRPKKAKSSTERWKAYKTRKTEEVGSAEFRQNERKRKQKPEIVEQETNVAFDTNESMGEHEQLKKAKSSTDRWRAFKKRKIEEVGDAEFRESDQKRKQKCIKKSRNRLQDTPIAFTPSTNLDAIERIDLKYTLLKDAKPCVHCGARLFQEELSLCPGRIAFPQTSSIGRRLL